MNELSGKFTLRANKRPAVRLIFNRVYRDNHHSNMHVQISHVHEWATWKPIWIASEGWGWGLGASAKARVRSLSKWSIRDADIRGVCTYEVWIVCRTIREDMKTAYGNRFTWPRMIIEVRPWNCIARRELLSSIERERIEIVVRRLIEWTICTSRFSLCRLSSVFPLGSIDSCLIDVLTEILHARGSSPCCENLREGRIFGNK